MGVTAILAYWQRPTKALQRDYSLSLSRQVSDCESQSRVIRLVVTNPWIELMIKKLRLEST